MYKKILILILFVLSSFSVFSQDSAWADMKLPANLSSDITSFSKSGDDCYLGTNGQGIFFSNDGGNTWINNSLASMNSDLLTGILIGLNQPTYVIGKNSIYLTNDKGSSWDELSTFPKEDGSIQCAAISPTGKLAIGTPLSLWYYSENVDGWFWSKLNIQYGPMDIRALGFNLNEQVFLSCIHNQLPKIYWIDPNGQMAFLEIINNIRESPLASFFDRDANGVMFTGVGKSIYQLDYAKNVWNLFTESPQKNVRRIKFSITGNLLSFDDMNLRIFNPKDNEWLPDNPLLNFDDLIIDASIDNNDAIWRIHKRKIIYSDVPVDKIISFIFSKYIIVKDAQGSPMRHKTFVLYKATCDNNQSGLGTITTNNNGGFYLSYSYYSLHTGDQIKLEKLVYTEYAVKTGRSAMGNKMYDVYLNNMKYDGVGNPHYYALTDDNSQTIFMDHTCIHRFLIFSVEWEAKRAYMDTIASWSKLMSNFLWDVTDGQLFVERVDIYDNYQKWMQADMRFYANNQVWPNAAINGVYSVDSRGDQVRMPRRWMGNGDATRNWTVRNDWFTYDDRGLQLFMSSTMAHELGHYMFSFYDEYVWVDTNKQKLMPADYNLGFMQYQYQNAPDWSSEMSDPDRYSNPNYRYTAQWAYNGSDCWTQFRTKYQGYYADLDGGDDIWVPIVFPKDRTLSGGLGFLRGPADYLFSQTQCSVYPNTEANVYDQFFSAGDFKFTVVDEHGNPMAKADIYDYVPFFTSFLLKTNQGQSADDGKMTVVGANVNDMIWISARRELNLGWPIGTIPWFYFYAVNVSAVTGVKDNDDQTQEELVIKLFPVKGEHRIVNSMKYDFSGKISLDFFTNKIFNSTPTADIFLLDSSVKKYNFTYNGNKSVYNLEVSEAIPDQGTIIFNTTDSVNAPFSILFNYQISDMGKNIFAPGGSAELTLDTKNTEIERVSVLSSNFFPLKNGVSSVAKQAGEVVSFSSAPSELSPGTTNILNIRYSKTELTTDDEFSLSIFKWDENNLIWNKLGSTVDTATAIVSAQINSLGTYAAFTTNTPVGVNDDEYDSFSLGAYPNPFSNSSKVDFFLTQPGFVSLKLFNALGKEVMTLANSYLNYGKQAFTVDGTQLPGGVYYLTLKANNHTVTKEIVLIK
ncbi:MAG: T9SS type A sorting domain-containing protein [Ignavibacteriae bacterium]|nr:T9SS type A sorting domain-containing protein [Ignavibacteriota bacterium]